MSVLKQLIESKVYRILTLLIKNRGKLFHLQKISHDSSVPLSSTFRIVNNLVRIGLVKTVKIGKMKIYKLAKGKEVDKLIKMLGEVR